MTEIVLDENVIKNAWHGKKPDGADALDDIDILIDVIKGKYRIHISEKIKWKLSKFRKNTQHITVGVNDFLLRKYMQLVYDSSTTIHTPIKTNFKGVKECDNEFVGVTLVLKTSGILVTADRRLKEAIEADMELKNNLCCKTSEEFTND